MYSYNHLNTHRGEQTISYSKPETFDYRITLPRHARTDGLLPEDFNNGYERLYQRIAAETDQ